MNFYDAKSQDEMRETIQKFQDNVKTQFNVDVSLPSIYSCVGAILQEMVAKFMHDTFADLTPQNLVITLKTIEEMLQPKAEEKPEPKLILDPEEHTATSLTDLQPKVNKGKGKR